MGQISRKFTKCLSAGVILCFFRTHDSSNGHFLKRFLLCYYNSLASMEKSLQEDNDLGVPQRGQQYETEMRSPYTELHNYDFRITEVLNHVMPLTLVLLEIFIALQYNKLFHKPEICGKRRKFKQLSGIRFILSILQSFLHLIFVSSVLQPFGDEKHRECIRNLNSTA